MANLSDIIHGGSATIGNRVLITSATASSSASITFTSGIDGTYNVYEVEITNLIAQTDDTTLRLRVSDDGGSTYESTSYYDTHYGGTSNVTGQEIHGVANVSYISLNNDSVSSDRLGNQTDRTYNGTVRFYRPSDGTAKTKFETKMIYDNTGRIVTGYGAGAREVATAVDALEFSMSSGNLVSGTFQLFGIST